jgi:hypothetical protein
LKSDDIFALAVLANLYTIKTKGEAEQFNRFAFKKMLYEIAMAKHFNREEIVELLTFVKDLMALPSSLELEFNNFVDEFNENQEEMMTYRPTTVEFIKIMYKHALGYNPTEKIDEVQKELGKVGDKLEKAIVNLYVSSSQSVEELAKTFDLTIDEVEAIIEKHRFKS